MESQELSFEKHSGDFQWVSINFFFSFEFYSWVQVQFSYLLFLSSYYIWIWYFGEFHNDIEIYSSLTKINFQEIDFQHVFSCLFKIKYIHTPSILLCNSSLPFRNLSTSRVLRTKEFFYLFWSELCLLFFLLSFFCLLKNVIWYNFLGRAS